MRNFLNSTARAVAVAASLASPAFANGGAGDITTNSNSNQNTSKSASDAEAAAAAAAIAANNNVVVVQPHTSATNTAHGGQGGNGIGIGHGGQGGSVGNVTTSVVNTHEYNERLQAGAPPSVVVAPTSSCGEGFGFAAGFVGGSVGASFSDINFRCVDTHAALTLFQEGATIEERGVALAALANLSPAFDEAITSVAETSIRCQQEMRATSSVLLAAGRCGLMMPAGPGRD